MVLPAISAVATLAVVALFATPLVIDAQFREGFFAILQSSKDDGEGSGSPLSKPELVGFLLSLGLACNFVTTYFNAALLGAADRAFRGKPTGIAAGLAVATRRLPVILAWSAANTLFGLALHLIERRVPFAGRLVLRLAGAAWAVACFFVVPALVVENIGPLEALRRSIATMRRTWGEAAIFTVGFGAAGTLVNSMLLLSTVGGIVAGALADSVLLGGSIVGAGLACFLAWTAVASALRAVVRLALFRYAATGDAPAGFELRALQQAFVDRA